MRRTRNRESGYALLLIFAMAAIVAITLYTEIPRVAFEAQRDKEQLLIDRGNEYARAVALFVRKFNRFPGSMEELENSNNQRFLRRRFVDPMTGKADWRILHAGPGGVITDSVTAVKKPDDGSSKDSTPSGIQTTQLQMFGVAQPGTTEAVNLATRQRPTDQVGAPGNLSNTTMGSSDQNGDASGNPPPNSGIPGYNGPVMVLPDGRIVPANTSGTAPPPPGTPGGRGSSPFPGGIPGMPGVPGVPGVPPGIPSSVPGGVPGLSNMAPAGNGMPPLPGGVAIQQSTQNNPPFPPNAAGPPSGAASLINQILTSPRPGGINGLPGGQGVTAQGNPVTTTPTATTATLGAASPQQQVIGAGIAGVASKREQEGIKEVNTYTKYNQWEFVYDVSKDPSRAGPGAAAAAQGAAGASGAQRTSGASGGTPAAGSSGIGSGFGGSGFGGSSPTMGSPGGTTLGH